MEIKTIGPETYAADWPANPLLPMRFLARAPRKERTGLHARLEIHLDSTVLAWSTFNVERDEDRVRLANSASKHIPVESEAAISYPPPHLKYQLDTFCRELGPALLKSVRVTRLSGTEAAPMPMVLHPYIVQEGGTILFGAPGRGKSFLSQFMAVSLAAGLSTLWPVPEPRQVLYVNLERSEKSVARRLGAVNRALNLPTEHEIPFVQARGRSLSEIADSLAHTIHEQETEVLFLDSISRAGAGDLNENMPANRITDLLNSLCPTWFALGHTPRPPSGKGDSDHLYGSQMFDAGADLLIRLTSEKRREHVLGVGLDVVKGTDLPAQRLQVWALEFTDDGLTGIRRADPGEFPEVEGAKTSIPDMIKRYLLRVGEAAASDIADEIGSRRDYVARLLANNEELQSRREGKRVLYAVRGGLE